LGSLQQVALANIVNGKIFREDFGGLLAGERLLDLFPFPWVKVFAILGGAL
jgi:hypothetical protein